MLSDTFSQARKLNEPSRHPFVTFLRDRETLTEAALIRAETIAFESNEHLVNVITRLGLVRERDMADALSQFLNRPVLDRDDYPTFPILEDCLSGEFLHEMKLVPIDVKENVLQVAMTNPLNSYAREAAGFFAGKQIEVCIALPADMDWALERLYMDSGTKRSLANGQLLSEHEGTRDDIEKVKDSVSDAPIIRLIHTVITRAVEVGASDIHFEPMENQIRIRYRIDGVLHEMERHPEHYAAPMISRIKVMAKLNIAERRLAQDGRIGLAIRGKEIDFRVATTPTTLGESAVLRILDRGSISLDFEQLGFDETFIRDIRSCLQKPHGIILVTGPTGSGKTTTLYTALSDLNTSSRKILTIEDPVEYELHGVNHVQVKPQIGISFANALRTFLRHDPDIMMIGEIRDKETAQVAVQAALTGHLILSTLHTNDVSSAVTRLRDMGVEDYLLTSTLNIVIAQRLVRLLCQECKTPFNPDADLLVDLGFDKNDSPDPPAFFRAVGCEKCNQTGYRGRTTIAELMPLSANIRRAILRDSDAAAIREIAIAEGMRAMRLQGAHKASLGVTTIDEVLRATREI